MKDALLADKLIEAIEQQTASGRRVKSIRMSNQLWLTLHKETANFHTPLESSSYTFYGYPIAGDSALSEIDYAFDLEEEQDG